MTAFRFDHAIIAVADLDAATADFQALGFTTFYGGQHADGKTHNVLVVFADGGYLELLAPVDINFLSENDTVDLTSFLDFVAKGDGWAGYALLADDLDSIAAGIRERGIHIGDSRPNSRLRPDGTRIAWRTMAVEKSRTPFFITDVTARVLRVPDDEDKITHPNGVYGVAGLVIAVHKLDKAIPHYRALLDLEPEQPGTGVANAVTADFHLGDFALTLAAPDDFGSPIHEYIKNRGEVPYLIRLRTSGHAGWQNLHLTHGAQIELVE
jgi:hypothetical protein